MKKMLLLPLIFITFSSFNLPNNEIAFFGTAFPYSIVTYDIKNSIAIGFSARLANFRETVNAKFWISKEANKNSKIVQNNCPPLLYEDIISSKVGFQIRFKGRVKKSIAINGFVFLATFNEIFILDIKTMRFSSFFKKEKGINDFTVINDQLYIATNKGIEIVSENAHSKIPFQNPITSINSTIEKKQIIITEKGTQNKKRILRIKDLKEKIIIKNQTILKNFVDLVSKNEVVLFDNKSNTLSLYNLKKELLKKKYIIPVEKNEEIPGIKVLDYNKNEITLEVTYKTGYETENIIEEIKLSTGEINQIEFQRICPNPITKEEHSR